MAKKYDYEKMLSDFNSEFGCVTIDKNIVKRFVREMKRKSKKTRYMRFMT